ncbi:MAG TPA: acetyltransferase [Bacteroidetes bacterium]|nr:acetyltransferase [Bacteroidota bacterium]
MSDTHVIIIGTGQEGRIAAEIFTAQNQVVLGFLETGKEISTRDLNDISVFAVAGDEDSLMVLHDQNIQYLVTNGEIKKRIEVYEAIAEITKRPATNAQHPGAYVSSYAAIGFGNIFNFGVCINPNVQVGDNNHFHSGVTVEPDVKIGNYCTINAGVRIGANVELEDQVFIGTGAVIHPGIKLGNGCLIGAGSVVLREVPAGATVHGNPAMPIG